DRAGISLAIALGILIFGLSGPLMGTLLARIGPRRVMVAGIALTITGLVTFLFTRQLWQLFFFWGVFTGLGTGAVSSSLGAIVATNWFKAQRGTVIGLFSTALSVGQLLFVPILLALTVSGGWRTAVIFLAAVGGILIVPAALLMRDRPSDVGLRPIGDSDAPGLLADNVEDVKRTSMREAFRRREFWLLAGSFFVCGYTGSGLLSTHLIPFTVDRGFSEATAATTVAVMGVMNIAGTLLSGYFTDRYDNRKLLAIYYGFRGLSLASLPFLGSAPYLLVFAVVYGLDSAATVPPTANLTARIFGKASLGTVYGWIFFVHMLGASTATYLGGLLRETLGDYQIAFMSAAFFGLLAGVFAAGIRLPERRVEVAPAT
ncbi:MAG: MFS transporter, partial [Chloroflexi bacterium]|nr:MFS transporter [Chloroflexota bacterium]